MDSNLTKTFSSAWILLALIAIFVSVCFAVTLNTNKTPVTPAWDMGGVSFVPASSPYAEGYYSPDVPQQGESPK